MKDENPYNPPNGEMLLPGLPPRVGKRPKSHKWVLFIFAALLAGRIYFVSNYPPKGALEWVRSLWVAIPLVPIVFFRYAATTYYICSAAVLGFSLEMLSVMLGILGGSWSYGMGIFLPHLLVCTIVVWPLYKLTRHYVFGTGSRAYYGLPPIRAAK